MKKHQIKVNDEVIAEIPFDNNEWEVKLYIVTKEGKHHIKAVCAFPEHKKNSYVGLTIP